MLDEGSTVDLREALVSWVGGNVRQFWRALSSAFSTVFTGRQTLPVGSKRQLRANGGCYKYPQTKTSVRRGPPGQVKTTIVRQLY